MNYFPNSSNSFYPTTLTTTTAAVYPLTVTNVGFPPAPLPEDEMAWLRRRVAEITELVAA